MNRSEIFQMLQELLTRLSRRLPAGFVLTENSSLTGDLMIDSADLVELVMDVEERFRIQVPDSALERLKTVGNVIDFVEQSQRAA